MTEAPEPSPLSGTLVLPPLQEDVNFLTAALSTYGGHEVMSDINAAWSRITGAISDHGAFRECRMAVALAAIARVNAAPPTGGVR